jgi:hypothetical protein
MKAPATGTEVPSSSRRAGNAFAPGQGPAAFVACLASHGTREAARSVATEEVRPEHDLPIRMAVPGSASWLSVRDGR